MNLKFWQQVSDEFNSSLGHWLCSSRTFRNEWEDNQQAIINLANKYNDSIGVLYSPFMEGRNFLFYFGFGEVVGLSPREHRLNFLKWVISGFTQGE